MFAVNRSRLEARICTLVGAACNSFALRTTRVLRSPPQLEQQPPSRRAFQPFSKEHEDELSKVITTKPRHVLKHVRQLVWRSRKKELHFRSMVTQLMIVVQDHLRQQLLDPTIASEIMEGVLEECVKLGQHDMAHLLFRAFLRFRRYGCGVTVRALRHLFDSYRGNQNKEMMLQLACEVKEEKALRSIAIAAYLFAGCPDEAMALYTSIPKAELGREDLVAIIEGFDHINKPEKIVALVDEIKDLKKLSKEDTAEVFRVILRIFYRRDDEDSFSKSFLAIQAAGIALDSQGFGWILRMRLKRVNSTEEISQVEQEVRDLGYNFDITGNSIVLSAYARVTSFGDQGSEQIILSKVETLLASIEARLKEGDPDFDITPSHVRAVIRGFGVAGKPDQMKEAWKRMQYKGISDSTLVYNELLRWFAMLGNVKELLACKEDMNAKGVIADAQTYTWMIRGLGRWYPRQVEKQYEELQQRRIRPDTRLFNALISVFGEMGNFKNVEALRSEVYQRAAAGSLQLNPGFFSALLRVYAKDRKQIAKIESEVKKAGLEKNDFVSTTILHAYCQHDDADDDIKRVSANIQAWQTDTYNVMLNRYAKRSQVDKFEETLNEMKQKNVAYNEITFGTLVTAYGRWKQIDKIQEALERMKAREGHISAAFYSILAATYSRLGDCEGIDDAWEDLVASKMFPDTDVFNQFLMLYSRHHNVQRMQTVMDSMLKQVPPNPLTATTVVDMLGKAGRIAEMENLVEDMGHSPDTAPTAVTYHQVMNAYAKSGDILKMEKAHQDMLSKGFAENCVTFNILADGYGRAKRMEQLIELVQRRQKLNIPMDELGYCVLINTYGKAKMVPEITKLGEEAKQSASPGVYTQKVVWAMIDAMCRCNDITQMERWIAELRSPRSSNDLTSLISYFSRVGMMERTEAIEKELTERKEVIQYAALNAMARGYARCGRFDKCVEVLHKIRDRKMVPDASTTLHLSSAFLKAGLKEQAQQIVQWRRAYAKPHQESPEGVIV